MADLARVKTGAAVVPTPTCAACSFVLWTPITQLGVADLGLYRDARYPGRCIVSLREHFEHLDEVPAAMLGHFMADIRLAAAALRAAVGADAIDIAVLGNTEPHVHAHLIPRSRKEPWWGVTIWEDPRPRVQLPEDASEQMASRICANLALAAVRTR